MKIQHKIARYVLMITAFLMALYGIKVIYNPYLFTNNMEIYAKVTMARLEVTYPRLTEYIDMLIKLIGGFNIIIGMVSFFTVYKSFKIKEKWLLVIIFLTSILGYVAPVSFDVISGVIEPTEIVEITGFGLIIIAFIILASEQQR